jgi:hypothetical protein
VTQAKWWAFFALFQALGALLFFPGLLICLSPTVARLSWLWWNSDDPPTGWGWLRAYKWLAFRNHVANMRRIPGCAGPGRPLIYHWWEANPADIKSGHYFKMGWESGPPYYPVWSAGSGRGF